MGKRHNKEANNIRTLENDYVRKADNKRQLSKAQQIRLRRRIIAFGIIATTIIVFLSSMYITQQKRLAEKKQQKEEIVSKLEDVKNQQEMLNLQITKLEDDEYIAKLARKEYFLSDEGEIIFTTPDEEDESNESNKSSDENNK